MLFKDTFYFVNSINRESGRAIFNITIDKNHHIFDGHFPDNPITPGVVQMEIIKELLSKIMNKEMRMISMSNCKFLAIINPIETPTLDVVLIYSEVEGNVKISGHMKSDEVTCMKISAIYQ